MVELTKIGENGCPTSAWVGSRNRPLTRGKKEKAMKEQSRMPARRRSTGENVRKQEHRPHMIFASYGDGERPIIIREGDRPQPRVTRVSGSVDPAKAT